MGNIERQETAANGQQEQKEEDKGKTWRPGVGTAGCLAPRLAWRQAGVVPGWVACSGLLINQLGDSAQDQLLLRRQALAHGWHRSLVGWMGWLTVLRWCWRGLGRQGLWR